MATVGSLSTTTSSNLYGASIKGYGGLASGLDTDTLIEGMTTGTRAKIAKQMQSKQKIQWQMDGYRSISDKLIQFAKKYTDITGANSLYRDSFFDKSIAALSGVNSSYVKVSGASEALDNVSIAGVKQLAKNASLLLNGDDFAAKELKTGTIDTSQKILSDVSLSGKSFTIDYGGTEYNIALTNGEELKDASGNAFKADYTTKEGIEKAINAKLKSIKLDASSTDTLGDKVVFSKTNNGGFAFTANGTPAKDITVKAGSDDALKILGFTDPDGTVKNGGSIGVSATGGLNGDTVDVSSLSTESTFADYIDGKNMTFSYNGVKKTIVLDKNAIGANADGSINVDDLASYINKKLDTAFGAGRINVSSSTTDSPNGELTFTTTDPTSVLKLVDAGEGLLGADGALKVTSGASNRLSMGATVGEYFGITGQKELKIEGADSITINETDSIADMMEKINKSGVVKVSYLETADRLVFNAVNDGALGNNVSFSGDFADDLFKGIASDKRKLDGGQDAIISVKYAGGGDPIELKRSSNTFDLEGSTITVSGTFGDYDASGKVIENSANTVSFTTSADSDKIIDTVSSMIDEYNALVELVNGNASTRPNRDYQPLTDEQKKEMSEDEIKAWNEKAKSGILFNDSSLTGMASELRYVFSGVLDIGSLEKMGITVSGDYKENGKITFDKDKFKAALDTDLDTVKNLFTEAPSANDRGGFMARMKSITDKYASTTGIPKGILIEKAGSTQVASSLTENTLQKKIDEYDEMIKQLKKKLQTEIDRYTKEFSSLEQIIAQMNSQSSWLSGAMG